MRLNKTADLHSPTPRTIAGIGRVLLWGGGSLWIGRDAGRGQAHAHHAIQLSLALSGRLQLLGDADTNWSSYSGAVVMPHQRHQFDGGGEAVAHIFIEPETMHGRALLSRYGGPSIHRLSDEVIEPLIMPLRMAYTNGAANDVLIAASERLVTQLHESNKLALSVDPRITRSIEFLRSQLHAPVSLTQAARVAHLSPSRFRHLFVAQTGISFRAYLLWARIESAVGAAMNGLSWTEAAQTWGFADSAHLSRTCRRMFGIAPSMLIRG